MKTYLIDTNHLSGALNLRSYLRRRFRKALRSGHRLATCAPVLCEVEAGIVGSADPEENHRSLEQLLELIRVWPMERPATREFGVLFHELRRAGVVLSQVDLMLAALAKVSRSTILSADQDFKRVNGIRVENWIDDEPAP
jgi:tRNA(fMet)-specific endonuclease VapC